MTADRPPNPGSDAALEQGCTCPVMDNGRGRLSIEPWPDGVWWVYLDCPLHGLATSTDSDIDTTGRADG